MTKVYDCANTINYNYREHGLVSRKFKYTHNNNKTLFKQNKLERV